MTKISNIFIRLYIKRLGLADKYHDYYGTSMYDDVVGYGYFGAKKHIDKLLINAKRHRTTDIEMHQQLSKLECKFVEMPIQNPFSPVSECNMGSHISIIGFQRYFSKIALSKIYKDDELKYIYKFYIGKFSQLHNFTNPYNSVEFINFQDVINIEKIKQQVEDHKKMLIKNQKTYEGECVRLINDIRRAQNQ